MEGKLLAIGRDETGDLQIAVCIGEDDFRAWCFKYSMICGYRTEIENAKGIKESIDEQLSLYSEFDLPVAINESLAVWCNEAKVLSEFLNDINEDTPMREWTLTSK